MQSDIIDLQTSFLQEIRKPRTRAIGGNKARTYVGDKGRDDEITAVLKHSGIHSKADYERARREADNPFGYSPFKQTGDEIMCGKFVSTWLDKAFKNTVYEWAIKIEDGLLTIFCTNISMKYGMHWNMDNGWPGERWLTWASGELLERHNARRDLKNKDHLWSDLKWKPGRGGYHIEHQT